MSNYLRKLARWYLNRIPIKKIENHYEGKVPTPTYLEDYDLWVVDTEQGLEYGFLEYILCEFAHEGVYYNFHNKNYPDNDHPDHQHTFSGVLETLVDNPSDFSIDRFESQYSRQEIDYIEAIKRKYQEIEDKGKKGKSC